METTTLSSLKKEIKKLNDRIDHLEKLTVKNDKNYEKEVQLFNDIFGNKNVDYNCSVDQDLEFTLYKFTDKLDLERECSISSFFFEELMNNKIYNAHTDQARCFIFVSQDSVDRKKLYKNITVITRNSYIPMPNIIKDEFCSQIINEIIYLLNARYAYETDIVYKSKVIPTKVLFIK